MVKISATLKVERKGDAAKHLAKLRKELAGPKMVKVGFPAGKVAGDLITIAFWNHEGTNRAKGDVFMRNGKVGISGPIPARPFITVAMFKGRGEVKALLRKEARAIVDGKLTMSAALPTIGMVGQDLIQVQIGSNMGPPNSGMTIALKGSSKTLVDQGRMFQSVTWAIDK